MNKQAADGLVIYMYLLPLHLPIKLSTGISDFSTPPPPPPQLLRYGQPHPIGSLFYVAMDGGPSAIPGTKKPRTPQMEQSGRDEAKRASQQQRLDDHETLAQFNSRCRSHAFNWLVDKA